MTTAATVQAHWVPATGRRSSNTTASRSSSSSRARARPWARSRSSTCPRAARSVQDREAHLWTFDDGEVMDVRHHLDARCDH